MGLKMETIRQIRAKNIKECKHMLKEIESLYASYLEIKDKPEKTKFDKLRLIDISADIEYRFNGIEIIFAKYAYAPSVFSCLSVSRKIYPIFLRSYDISKDLGLIK